MFQEGARTDFAVVISSRHNEPACSAATDHSHGSTRHKLASSTPFWLICFGLFRGFASHVGVPDFRLSGSGLRSTSCLPTEDSNFKCQNTPLASRKLADDVDTPSEPRAASRTGITWLSTERPRVQKKCGSPSDNSPCAAAGHDSLCSKDFDSAIANRARWVFEQHETSFFCLSDWSMSLKSSS